MTTTSTVHTIGHSTRGMREFLDLLDQFGVDLVVDVRSIPRSRHVPHFNAEELEDALAAHETGYVHLAGLGGRRPTSARSPNTGWRNKSFRGYADHMASGVFLEALAELLALAERRRPVVMCAEAVPWRCHRSLVGDALLVRGVRVVDILDRGQSREQTLTSFARVDGHALTYPDPEADADPDPEGAQG